MTNLLLFRGSSSTAMMKLLLTWWLIFFCDPSQVEGLDYVFVSNFGDSTCTAFDGTDSIGVAGLDDTCAIIGSDSQSFSCTGPVAIAFFSGSTSCTGSPAQQSLLDECTTRTGGRSAYVECRTGDTLYALDQYSTSDCSGSPDFRLYFTPECSK